MLYAPPKDLETRVFATLPDKFRIEGKTAAWTKGQGRTQPTDSFIEGPSFDRDGNLYIVDIPYGRIFRISPDGKDVELAAEYDGEPNGLKIHQDGRIFIADYRNGIMVMDPASGRVDSFIDRELLDPFKGCNDLVFASNGDLYFTDQGMTGLHDPTGKLYRKRANGILECLVDNVPSPNGLVLNLEETAVYLNVTRANAVWRVPMRQDGSVFKVGTFIQLSGSLGGPDGIAVDEGGNLAVVHFGSGSVWVFSKLGEPVYRIRSCRGLGTTNVAYGGPENKTLYITESESGTVLACDMPVAGRKMYSHM